MANLVDYTVGWICAIPTEYAAVQAFLDEEHEGPEYVSPTDKNDYTLGKIGEHNVVIAVLPGGEYGIESAAIVARDMLHSFSNVRIGLMVGIGGGTPSLKHDIRLGDIVVSEPRDWMGGVIQYDFDKAIQGHSFSTMGFLNQPPTTLLTAVNGVKAQYKRKGHGLEGAINNILDENPRDRWTPLHGASEEGYVEVLQLLLEKAADINATNLYEWTPLLHYSRGAAPQFFLGRCSSHSVRNKLLYAEMRELTMSLERAAGREDDAANIPGSSSAEDKVAAVSEATHSTTLSDKESVFSTQPGNTRAPSTKLSCDDHHSFRERQVPRGPRLQEMVETSPANVHGAGSVELQEIEQVIPRTRDLYLNEDRRNGDYCGDLESHSDDDDTLHPGKDIFADNEIRRHIDFMADPAHKYWTWSDKERNWSHKDEEMNTTIWAPLDFD